MKHKGWSRTAVTPWSLEPRAKPKLFCLGRWKGEHPNYIFPRGKKLTIVYWQIIEN